MVNRAGLRLVGVDRDEVEIEPPATYSFADYVHQFRSAVAGEPVDPIKMALAALNDVSRRMEDLAKDLNVFGHFENSDDTDRPRAA